MQQAQDFDGQYRMLQVQAAAPANAALQERLVTAKANNREDKDELLGINRKFWTCFRIAHFRCSG